MVSTVSVINLKEMNFNISKDSEKCQSLATFGLLHMILLPFNTVTGSKC